VPLQSASRSMTIGFWKNWVWCQAASGSNIRGRKPHLATLTSSFSWTLATWTDRRLCLAPSFISNQLLLVREITIYSEIARTYIIFSRRVCCCRSWRLPNVLRRQLDSDESLLVINRNNLGFVNQLLKWPNNSCLFVWFELVPLFYRLKFH